MLTGIHIGGATARTRTLPAVCSGCCATSRRPPSAVRLRLELARAARGDARYRRAGRGVGPVLPPLPPPAAKRRRGAFCSAWGAPTDPGSSQPPSRASTGPCRRPPSGPTCWWASRAKATRRFATRVDLIEALPLSYLHVFPFPPRPGTAAFDFPDRVPDPVIKARCRQPAPARPRQAQRLPRALHRPRGRRAHRKPARPENRAAQGGQRQLPARRLRGRGRAHGPHPARCRHRPCRGRTAGRACGGPSPVLSNPFPIGALFTARAQHRFSVINQLVDPISAGCTLLAVLPGQAALPPPRRSHAGKQSGFTQGKTGPAPEEHGGRDLPDPGPSQADGRRLFQRTAHDAGRHQPAPGVSRLARRRDRRVHLPTGRGVLRSGEHRLGEMPAGQLVHDVLCDQRVRSLTGDSIPIALRLSVHFPRQSPCA
ncbi:MAG: hypothetical protein MZV70_10530 [Desulfobacterales bacterium]|nr:hypothetical protein [Desulfobacterales bacterium]